jgi:hypothetical protein
MAFFMELFCLGSSTFLAGSGGRVVASYAGARIVYMRPPLLVPLLVVVLVESRDRWDILEEVVRTESLEPLRRKLPACEGWRGGRLGGNLGVLFRGGGRGGSAGDFLGASGSTCAGWLPKCLADVGASYTGGLFTVWCLCAAGGLCDGGGGGGFFFTVVACSYANVGRLPGAGACTCSMLSAAMRSLIEAAIASDWLP